MKDVITGIAERFYSRAIAYGPRIVMALLLLIAGQWLIGLFVKWCRSILAKRKLSETLKPFLINLFRVLLQIMLLLVIMQVLGIKMTLFAALVGALGVAAGLALSGTLQNFTSGILIIMLRPFRIGDNIRTQGEEGTVTAIKLFSTTIVTFTNTTLIVPNSKLSNEVIFNLTLKSERRYDIVLGFAISTDYEQVKKQLLEAINSCSTALQHPPVRIGIKQLNKDGYDVEVNVWLPAHDFEDNKKILNHALYKQLRSMKVDNTA